MALLWGVCQVGGMEKQGCKGLEDPGGITNQTICHEVRQRSDRKGANRWIDHRELKGFVVSVGNRLEAWGARRCDTRARSGNDKAQRVVFEMEWW